MKRVLLFFVLWSWCTHAAVLDLGRYLGQEEWEVEFNDGKPIVAHPDYPFENYRIRSAYGKAMHVEIVPPFYIQRAVSRETLYHLLNVVSFPEYPLYVKRGEHGIPRSADDVKKFNPNLPAIFVNSSDGNLTALLSPLMAKVTDDDITADKTPRGLADRVKILLLSHALGTRIVNMQYFRGRYVAQLEHSFFEMYGEKQQPFSQFARIMVPKMKEKYRIDFRIMNEWTVEQVGAFYADIADFFGRVKAVCDTKTGDSDMRILLRPYLDSFANEPSPRYQAIAKTSVAIVEQRLLAMIGEGMKYLEAQAVDFRGHRDQLVAATTEGYLFPRELFRRLEYKKPPEIDGAIAMGASAKATLFRLITNSNLIVNSYAATWVPQYGTDYIGKLKVAAGQDASILLVANQYLDTSMTNEPQLFLNERTPRTIVVFSPNDGEGRAIADMLDEVAPTFLTGEGKTRIFPVAIKGVERGILTADEKTKILRLAVENDIEEILYVEMEGDQFDFIDQIKKIKLVPIDHHNNRRNRLSALEQLAERFGITLPLPYLVKGVMDREGSAGLATIYLSKEQGIRYFLQTRQGRSLRSTYEGMVRAYEAAAIQPGGKLFVVMHDQLPRRLPDFSNPISLLRYGEVPWALGVGNGRLMFCGDTQLQQLIEKELNGSFRKVSGGDARVSYLMVYGPTGELKGIARRLEDVAMDYAETCRQEVRILSLDGTKFYGH